MREGNVMATAFGIGVMGAVLLSGACEAAAAGGNRWSDARPEHGPRAVLGEVGPGAPTPALKAVFDSVSADHLLLVLKEMTGGVPVTVGGQTYAINDRYLPESKAKFRAYWLQFFRALGLEAQEMSYATSHSIGEAQGHNLEAVLPGRSKDSVVIIVHYDSIGPAGAEAGNPGVDDDMTGMSTLLETVRVLAKISAERGGLEKTVRFVAADYEEHASPGLEGARTYAAYIKKLAQDEGFTIVAAVDNEQSGWNCAADSLCGDDSNGTMFDVFSCSGDSNGFDHKALGDALEQTALTYSELKVNRGCIGQNSDHYAMWEIGVPAVVFSEHNPFANPHFDQNGGDTFDKIDQGYFLKIARVGVTFAAALAGL